MSSSFSTRELTTAIYTATLQNGAGVPIVKANIVSAQLTLKDVDTGEVINSRLNQNIIDDNNVTIHDTSGLLTWTIQPEDNVLINPARQSETHRAVFDIVYSSTQRLRYELYLQVRNITE